MAWLEVKVEIPPFGNPDVSLTAQQLGQHARGGRRPSDVWELVRLTNSKVTIDPQEVTKAGNCYYVNSLHIGVQFDLEYFVASELPTNVTNATNAGEKATANFHRWLLQRVKGHAKEHYDQFVEASAAWEADVKKDLTKALPTKKKPTSAQELEIKNGIGVLVADWIVELNFRLNQKAFDWEKTDYPKIESQMKQHVGVSVFMPTGLSLPSTPQSPTARRKIKFDPCRPRKR